MHKHRTYLYANDVVWVSIADAISQFSNDVHERHICHINGNYSIPILLCERVSQLSVIEIVLLFAVF